MPKIDTFWFVNRIKDKYHSLRQFSKLLTGRKSHPLDVSAVSLMLRGKREMTINEAVQISKLLNEPLIDVIKRAYGKK